MHQDLMELSFACASPACPPTFSENQPSMLHNQHDHCVNVTLFLSLVNTCVEPAADIDR